MYCPAGIGSYSSAGQLYYRLFRWRGRDAVVRVDSGRVSGGATIAFEQQETPGRTAARESGSSVLASLVIARESGRSPSERVDRSVLSIPIAIIIIVGKSVSIGHSGAAYVIAVTQRSVVCSVFRSRSIVSVYSACVLLLLL